LDSDVPGRAFLLKTTQLGSVSLGSPVFYRGLSVGQVLGWDINDMAQSVTIHAFVRRPFDTYVHDETRFWNASGVSVKLGGAGVEMQMESIRALLLGGIAFETPTTGPSSEVSAANHEFPLFVNQDAARAASYSRKIPLLVYFSSSVRGLGPGSEVVMHGLKVGEVTDVRLSYNPTNDAIVAPVSLEIAPERVVGIGRKVFQNTGEAVQALVSKGLRATLQSGNLLTGEMLVSLEIVPNAPPATVTMEGAELEVQRLDLDRDGSLILSGQCSVSFKSRPSADTRSFRISQPASSAAVEGQVAATSKALAQVADRIAQMLASPPSRK
jgi:paraquat-inducible protein B